MKRKVDSEKRLRLWFLTLRQITIIHNKNKILGEYLLDFLATFPNHSSTRSYLWISMDNFQKARHERIKYLLRLKKSSLSKAADELGISISTVSIVSHGRGKSARVQEHISTILGVPCERIWPEQYGDEEQHDELDF